MVWGLDGKHALVVVLCSLVFLAGCIEAIDRIEETGEGDKQFSEDGVGLTAKQAHQAADPHAHQWHPSSKLMLVSTVEHVDLERLSEMLTNASVDPDHLIPDPSIGDGLAPQWVLKYADPDQEEAILVLVNQKGHVETVEEVSTVRGERFITMEAWNVDSDEALATLKEDPEVRDHLEHGEPEQVIWTLVHPDASGLLWQVWVHGLAEAPFGGPASGAVFVDATTGERAGGPGQKVEVEPVRLEGTLGENNQTAREEIHVQEDQAILQTEASWRATEEQEQTPRVNVTLLHEGDPVEPSEGTWGDSSLFVTYEGLDPGAYTIEVRLEEAVFEGNVEYSLMGHILPPKER